MASFKPGKKGPENIVYGAVVYRVADPEFESAYTLFICFDPERYRAPLSSDKLFHVRPDFLRNGRFKFKCGCKRYVQKPLAAYVDLVSGSERDFFKDPVSDGWFVFTELRKIRLF